MRRGASVLGTFIDARTWDETLGTIADWVARKESRYVCICNVHSVVTASRDTSFCDVIAQSDMSTADGMPIVWFLRWLGFKNQQRINGPDLMWKYCCDAAKRKEAVFLYGSTEPVLGKLRRRLEVELPGMKMAGCYSPPFRELGSDEDDALVDMINESGADVVFVSLGCPKQERWMADHRGRIDAVMIGVGAAFDYHAGTLKRAPLWMQSAGLEWVHRLASEPRRLWKRYLVTNSLFVIGMLRQMLANRCGKTNR